MCFRVKGFCGFRGAPPEKVSRVVAILNIALGAMGILGYLMLLASLIYAGIILRDIRGQNQQMYEDNGGGGSSEEEVEVEMPVWVVPFAVFGLFVEICRVVFGALLHLGVKRRDPRLVLAPLCAGAVDIALMCAAWVAFVAAAGACFAGHGLEVADMFSPVSLGRVVDSMGQEQGEDFKQTLGLVMGTAFAAGAVFSALYITTCVFIYAAVYSFYMELKEGQEEAEGKPGKHKFVLLENP